jgi:hypothetical protein
MIYMENSCLKIPKINHQNLIKNPNVFWPRQVPTFSFHHLLVGSFSLDAQSADKVLKEALENSEI